MAVPKPRASGRFGVEWSILVFFDGEVAGRVDVGGRCGASVGVVAEETGPCSVGSKEKSAFAGS
ncbi:hypothetical protein [Methylosinus sp. Ce-a6]|uniref:hypothetical protein n=1 Tax=Methylosinus sp. Ce-a6 TaxID=2172005 RepID=UPI00135B7B2F|nr:hypothetical protein [Methylosinus sp. Ce-a6]